MSDFISFNEFVDRTDSAKFEHHHETIARGMQFPAAAAREDWAPARPAATDDAMEAEFDKMKQFVLGLYNDVVNVKSQHTFLGPDGNFVDSILFEQQPTYRAAKKAKLKLPTRAPTATRSDAAWSIRLGIVWSPGLAHVAAAPPRFG